MPVSALSLDTPPVEISDDITLAHAIVDAVHDPLLVLDNRLRVGVASRSFYQTFHLAEADVRGRLLYEIDGGQWNILKLRTLLEATVQNQAAAEVCEVDREFPLTGRRTMLLNARRLSVERGAAPMVLLAFEDITERRGIERQLGALLKEKDLLLEEMRHRFANSLQLIASILLIKARAVQSEETRVQLQDAYQRVLSFAAVQRHLHVPGHGGPIAIGPYLTKLCESLAQSLLGDSRPISLKVEADAGSATSPRAVSIGLIVTEAVMNALKHAFPDERPGAAILVSYRVSDAGWRLTISDNGVGSPAVGINPHHLGLGASLVRALALQLEAVVEVKSDAHGRAMTITHAAGNAMAAEGAIEA